MGKTGTIGERKPLPKGWRRYEGKSGQAFFEHRRIEWGSENTLVLFGEGCGTISKD